MMYSLTNVTKKYGDRCVLEIDSLEINEGGIYSLLGPNGAGKTTLLSILGLLDPPTTGKVMYGSRRVHFSEPLLQPLRKEVVMVDQSPILFTTSVYKNMEFGLKVRKIPKNNRRQIIAEALELVGLEHMAHAPAHTLSGGETQRVALARALALSPKVMLCDEPTSNVDLENQPIIVNLLKQLNRDKQITIVFTTHDKLQAASLAEHNLFLDHGRLTGSLYENLFSASIKKLGNCSRCTVAGFFDIDISTTKTGKARILIDPTKIKLSKESHQAGPRPQPGIDSSYPVLLNGKILQLVSEKETVRIVVESTMSITVALPWEQYREQQLLVGEEVILAIPQTAIEVL
ncbi:MAG: ABC transporter ATP-binding protein [Proteobacteria bacterium]|nr:ABC transporter ATP-binding protein [Pseudomonadota bacterium]